MPATFHVATSLALALTVDAWSWSTTHTPEELRRLGGVAVTASHTAVDDAKCVVAGYNTDNPAQVAVGGPCSKLNMTDPDDPTPLPGFRFVVMETLEVELGNGQETAKFKHIPGTDVAHAEDHSTHAEVGVLAQFHFKDTKHRHGAVHASTTSYLSKGTFDLNKNSFVVDKKGDDGKYPKLDMCVAKCCDSPSGPEGCSCNDACPTDTKIAVSPGQYKYSIMVAAFDKDIDSSYTEATGWKGIVEKIGTGDPKKISGAFIDVYQTIDLSNMGGGTVKVTPPAGSWHQAISYADMVVSSEENGIKVYNVSSLAVTAGSGWGGIYSFPLTFNTGKWEAVSGGGKVTAKSTRTVVINCIKPSAKILAEEGFEGPDGETDEAGMKKAMDAGKLKVIFVRYRFDVTGIHGSKNDGFIMAYDPTVENDATAMKDSTTSSTAGAIRNTPLAIAAVAVIIAAMAAM